MINDRSGRFSAVSCSNASEQGVHERDVAAEEPLPPSSRLWDMPNVILTPHVGGQSVRRADDVTDFFCENLRRYLGGEPLLNHVDKNLGFPVRRSILR